MKTFRFALLALVLLLSACGDQIGGLSPSAPHSAPLLSPIPTPRAALSQRELDLANKDKAVNILSANDALARLRGISPLFAENERTPPVSPLTKVPFAISVVKTKHSDVSSPDIVDPEISPNTEIWVVRLPLDEWSEVRGPAGATVKSTFNTYEFWLRSADGRIIGAQKRMYPR